MVRAKRIGHVRYIYVLVSYTVYSVVFFFTVRSVNKLSSSYQYSRMAPRLSGQNCKFFKFLLSLNSQKRLEYRENNKHLMTGLEGKSEFCFPRISMFSETKSRETLRFEGNKIHSSPRDQSLSDLLYGKAKQKQILNNALRFQQQRSTFRG